MIFQELCEAHELPLPGINARVAGWEVDALWRDQRLVVEIDRPGNHRTPAQVRRDRQKELDLRAAHHAILRYSDEQLKGQGPTMAGEIRAWLNLML